MTRRMKAFRQKCAENAKLYQEEKDNRETEIQTARGNKLSRCNEFLTELTDILKESYVLCGSCNKDASRYLVPNGTETQISYYGKPVNSFRLSDHWNWYAGLRKCSDPNYIQCESVDMPKARERKEAGKGTDAIIGVQVAVQLEDGKYHHIFGDKWNPRKHAFEWEENNALDILKKYNIQTA